MADEKSFRLQGRLDAYKRTITLEASGLEIPKSLDGKIVEIVITEAANQHEYSPREFSSPPITLKHNVPSHVRYLPDHHADGKPISLD
jgi:hypothetical protein